jgi:hypothetical protein
LVRLRCADNRCNGKAPHAWAYRSLHSAQRRNDIHPSPYSLSFD